MWVASLMFFWLSDMPDDTHTVIFLALYIQLLVVTFGISAVIGYFDFCKKLKWLWAAVFGVMYTLLHFLTMNLSYIRDYDEFIFPSVILFSFGAVLSLIGLLIGTAIKAFKVKRGEKIAVK